MISLIWYCIALILLALLSTLWIPLCLLFFLVWLGGEWKLRSMRHSSESRALLKSFKKHTSWLQLIAQPFGLGSQAVVMLIGPSGDGKTQLLSFTEPLANFNPTVPATLHKAKPVFYIAPQSASNTSFVDSVEKTIQALVPLKETYPLQSIVVTMGAHQASLGDAMEEVLTLIASYQKHWPWLKCQIMLTQTDQLAGFDQAFGALPIEIKKTSLGLLLPNKIIVDQDLGQIILQQVNYLSNQVASFGSGTREWIQSLQSIKPQLCHITSKIGQYLPVQGLFFTSTCTNPPFFMEDWLQQKHQIQPYRHHTKSLFRLSWLTSCIILSLYFTGLEVQKEMKWLTELKPFIQKNDNSLIEKIEHLEQAKNRKSHSHFIGFAAIQKQLDTAIQHAYKKSLKHDFKDMLQRILEQQLAIHSSETIKDFSTYLELCANESKHPEKIAHWFDGYWQDHHHHALYSKHLDKLLKHPFACETNKKLVSEAKQYIDSIPNEQLLILLTQNAFTQENPGEIFFSLKHKNHILSTMLEQNFNDIAQYEESNMSTEDLTHAKQVYLKRYHDFWSEKLKALSKKDYSSLTIIKQALEPWQTEGTYLKTLTQIFSQTNGIDESEAFQKAVTQSILHENIDIETALNDLKQWINAFNEYLETMDTPSKQLAQTQARFKDYPNDDFSKLEKSLQSLPQVVQELMEPLLKASWEQMTQSSQKSISQAWQQKFASTLKTIKEQYPINLEAKQELPLHQFHELFGQEGQLMQFIQHTLGPFLVHENTQWQWKMIGSSQLSHETALIDWLNANAAMHQMLYHYPDKPDNPWDLTIVPLEESHDALLTISQDNTQLSVQNETQHFNLHIPDTIDQITISHKSDAETIVKHYTGNWAWLRALNQAQIKKLTTKDNQRTLSIRFEPHDTSFEITASTSTINALTSGLFKKLSPPELIFE